MEQQIKVEEALTDAIKQLDKGLLRKAKVKSFPCPWIASLAVR